MRWEIWSKIKKDEKLSEKQMDGLFDGMELKKVDITF